MISQVKLKCWKYTEAAISTLQGDIKFKFVVSGDWLMKTQKNWLWILLMRSKFRLLQQSNIPGTKPVYVAGSFVGEHCWNQDTIFEVCAEE